MRRAGNRDGNHAELRDGLRAGGLLVADTGGMGDGFPDLVVGSRRPPCPTCRRRPLTMLEVKDGRRPPSARKLSEDEEKFHAIWGDHVRVVESLEAAYGALGIDIMVQ